MPKCVDLLVVQVAVGVLVIMSGKRAEKHKRKRASLSETPPSLARYFINS